MHTPVRFRSLFCHQVVAIQVFRPNRPRPFSSHASEEDVEQDEEPKARGWGFKFPQEKRQLLSHAVLPIICNTRLTGGNTIDENLEKNLGVTPDFFAKFAEGAYLSYAECYPATEPVYEAQDKEDGSDNVIEEGEEQGEEETPLVHCEIDPVLEEFWKEHAGALADLGLTTELEVVNVQATVLSVVPCVKMVKTGFFKSARTVLATVFGKKRLNVTVLFRVQERYTIRDQDGEIFHSTVQSGQEDDPDSWKPPVELEDYPFGHEATAQYAADNLDFTWNDLHVWNFSCAPNHAKRKLNFAMRDVETVHDRQFDYGQDVSLYNVNWRVKNF